GGVGRQPHIFVTAGAQGKNESAAINVSRTLFETSVGPARPGQNSRHPGRSRSASFPGRVDGGRRPTALRAVVERQTDRLGPRVRERSARRDSDRCAHDSDSCAARAWSEPDARDQSRVRNEVPDAGIAQVRARAGKTASTKDNDGALAAIGAFRINMKT